jgi:hypothetical protein
MYTRLVKGEELDLFIKRHKRRQARFIKEGLSIDKAYDLAEQLFDRDADPMGDDRRICFECKNYNDEKTTCSKITDKFGRPQIPMRFMLQRCAMFEIREKK